MTLPLTGRGHFLLRPKRLRCVMPIKNAPSGAMITIESTATVSTISPQPSPLSERNAADRRLQKRRDL